MLLLLLFAGCLTPQQHAGVSQGRICLAFFTCSHTRIEVADQIRFSSDMSEMFSPVQAVMLLLLLFAGCLTPQQHAGVSQGRICLAFFTCSHTRIEVADQIRFSSDMSEMFSPVQAVMLLLLLFAGCLTPQQHAGVSQGRICLAFFTCSHTRIEVADQIRFSSDMSEMFSAVRAVMLLLLFAGC